MQSTKHQSERHVEMLAQCTHGAGNSAHSNDMIRASISMLFLLGCPFHVGWKIAKRIINAFNAQFWMRAFSHVSEKMSERLTPSLAHSNPTSTIILELWIVAIMASLNHAFPDSVNGSAAMRMFPSFAFVTAFKIGRAHV